MTTPPSANPIHNCRCEPCLTANRIKGLRTKDALGYTNEETCHTQQTSAAMILTST